MPVSASLTIPITAPSEAAGEALAAAFGSALGTSHVAIDALAAKAMLHFHFPGDLDALMDVLYRRGLTHSATVAFAVRVKQGTGSVTPAQVVGRLAALPAVSNPAFDGTTISATIAAATGCLRRVYDEVVALGLIPVEAGSPSTTRRSPH